MHTIAILLIIICSLFLSSCGPVRHALEQDNDAREYDVSYDDSDADVTEHEPERDAAEQDIDPDVDDDTSSDVETDADNYLEGCGNNIYQGTMFISATRQ